MWLVPMLVGTTCISADIHEILTVQCLVMPKHAGANGSKINADGVSLKQACSGQYPGSLKLSSRTFERAQNGSISFLILFQLHRK